MPPYAGAVKRRCKRAEIRKGFVTREDYRTLVELSWRYAILIGIVSHNDIVSPKIVRQDRERFPHLIKTLMGEPLFDDRDGHAFMQETSGLPERDCLLVFREQWITEHCEFCNGIVWPVRDIGIKKDDHVFALECERCRSGQTPIIVCFGDPCPWCEFSK